MDVERTIQFLLEQQARFDAQQAELAAQFAARQAEFDARLAKFVVQFEGRQGEFAAQFAARQAEFAAQFAARQVEFAAQFAARQVEFDARQAKFQEDISQIESIMVSVTASHQRTNKILEVLTEKHVQLAEAQRTTEQKLHVVIAALERHIADHT